MKEETVSALEKSLVTILDKTIVGVEQGVAFLSSEIPDVVRQLLLWHGMKNLIFFLVGLVMIASSAYIIKYASMLRKKDEFDWDNEGYLLQQIFYYGLSLLIFGLSFIGLNIEWIQVWIAPKVWLIEYAASLVK